MRLADLAKIDPELVSPSDITPVSLNLREDLTFAEWKRIGKPLDDIGRAYQWWVCDWIRFGKKHFPHTWQQAIPEMLAGTTISQQTIYNWTNIGDKFPENLRHYSLHFSHHAEVACLDSPDERERFLNIAEERKLSTSALRGLVVEWRKERQGVLDAEEQEQERIGEGGQPLALIPAPEVTVARTPAALVTVAKEMSRSEVFEVISELTQHYASWGTDELKPILTHLVSPDDAELVDPTAPPKVRASKFLKAALDILGENVPPSYVQALRRLTNWLDGNKPEEPAARVSDAPMFKMGEGNGGNQ